MQQRRVSAPFPLQVSRMLRRLERHPVRAIHTMRATDPPAHPFQLLPPARSITRHLPKRVPADFELRIKTRLHQLPRSVGQQRRVEPRHHARHQGPALRLRHSSRRATLILAQRTGQSALGDQRPQLRRKPPQLCTRHRLRTLRMETRDYCDHEPFKFFRMLVHPPVTPRQTPLAVKPPQRRRNTLRRKRELSWSHCIV